MLPLTPTALFFVESGSRTRDVIVNPYGILSSGWFANFTISTCAQKRSRTFMTLFRPQPPQGCASRQFRHLSFFLQDQGSNLGNDGQNIGCYRYIILHWSPMIELNYPRMVPNHVCHHNTYRSFFSYPTVKGFSTAVVVKVRVESYDSLRLPTNEKRPPFGSLFC